MTRMMLRHDLRCPKRNCYETIVELEEEGTGQHFHCKQHGKITPALHNFSRSTAPSPDIIGPICPSCGAPVEIVAPKLTPHSAYCETHGLVYLTPVNPTDATPSPDKPPPHYEANHPDRTLNGKNP